MRVSFVALAAALAVAGQAQAAEFVKNGGFELNGGVNTEVSTNFGTSTVVTDWVSPTTNAYNLLFKSATATTVDAASRFPGEDQRLSSSFNSPSNNGGYLMALDGDSDVRGAFEQTIDGLTAGQSYTLTFEWGATQLSNRRGDTTEQLQVSFGNQTFLTEVLNVPEQTFTGWRTKSFNFTATNSTQVLSFLSIGTPNGLPPVALLDGVSLTGGVPEPATWGMMILGFGLVGVAHRRRRSAIVAA